MSIWGVLVSNVALTVKVMMSMLSVIFGGGTAIFNVFLSAVSSCDGNHGDVEKK